MCMHVRPLRRGGGHDCRTSALALACALQDMEYDDEIEQHAWTWEDVCLEALQPKDH